MNLIFSISFTVRSKSSISLQKHHFRSEHWMITQGQPKITINKNKFYKKNNRFGPRGGGSNNNQF